jgi:hypothetical protein
MGDGKLKDVMLVLTGGGEWTSAQVESVVSRKRLLPNILPIFALSPPSFCLLREPLDGALARDPLSIDGTAETLDVA